MHKYRYIRFNDGLEYVATVERINILSKDLVTLKDGLWIDPVQVRSGSSGEWTNSSMTPFVVEGTEDTFPEHTKVVSYSNVVQTKYDPDLPVGFAWEF